MFFQSLFGDCSIYCLKILHYSRLFHFFDFQFKTNFWKLFQFCFEETSNCSCLFSLCFFLTHVLVFYETWASRFMVPPWSLHVFSLCFHVASCVFERVHCIGWEVRCVFWSFLKCSRTFSFSRDVLLLQQSLVRNSNRP